MLQKNPKPVFRRYLKRGAVVLFAAEAIGFAISYGVWHRMNTNREFRLYMHNNFPWALEGFYKFGEFMSSENKSRQLDSTVWSQEQKITKN